MRSSVTSLRWSIANTCRCAKTQLAVLPCGWLQKESVRNIAHSWQNCIDLTKFDTAVDWVENCCDIPSYSCDSVASSCDSGHESWRKPDLNWIQAQVIDNSVLKVNKHNYFSIPALLMWLSTRNSNHWRVPRYVQVYRLHEPIFKEAWYKKVCAKYYLCRYLSHTVVL